MGVSGMEQASRGYCMNCQVRLFALIGAVVASLICGCKSKVNTPEDASLKDNVYTNKFFGFQVRIPDTWTVLKKPSARDVRKSTEGLLGGERIGTSASRAAKRNRYLLLTRNVVQGTSIGVLAHPVDNLPGVENGEDFLDELMELGAAPGQPLQQVGEVTKVRLASRDFYRADVSMQVMGQKQHSALFATVEKGYILMIMVAAKSEAKVDEVIAQVGLTSNAAEGRRGVTTVAAREPWFNEIKLQGISGSGARRLAIINGKTFAAGDTNVVKIQAKTVTVRCLEIGEKSATVTFDGVEEKRELKLGVF